MQLHADFQSRALVSKRDYRWVTSPQAGVERMMLDRIGAEKARATSIVRYAPESYFPAHSHPMGEEILVLDGTFSDESGDYPAGWYLRNPDGSSHTPFSKPGAEILVKLRQMPVDDDVQVRINTRDERAWHTRGNRSICPLHSSSHEQVCLQKIPAGDVLFSGLINSAEILLLAGSIELDGQAYERGSWLRFPSGDAPRLIAGPDGATLYLKTGHLEQPVSLPSETSNHA